MIGQALVLHVTARGRHRSLNNLLNFEPFPLRNLVYLYEMSNSLMDRMDLNLVII